MAQLSPTPKSDVRLKGAELLSSIGAVVVGAGLALVFADVLDAYKLPILIFGLVAHAFGMFRKHRLERQETVLAWWAEVLYWLCWLALGGLLLMIVLS